MEGPGADTPSPRAQSRSLGRERAAAAPRSRETQRSDGATAARPGFFEPPMAEASQGPAPLYRPRPILVYIVRSSPSSPIRAPPSPNLPCSFSAPLSPATPCPVYPVPARSCLFLPISAPSCPVLPGSARFCSVLPRPTLSCSCTAPAHTSHALPTPCRILQGPTPSFPITPCPVLSHPALFCPVALPRVAQSSPFLLCASLPGFASREPWLLWVLHNLTPGRRRSEAD